MSINTGDKYFTLIKIQFYFIICLSLYFQVTNLLTSQTSFDLAVFFYFSLFLLSGIFWGFKSLKSNLQYSFEKSDLEILIPFTLIAFAFFSRIQINEFKQAWGDELYQFYEAQKINAPLAAGIQHQTPLDYMIHFFCFKIFGVSYFSLRFSAIFFSSLTLGNFYFLFKKLSKDYLVTFILLGLIYFNMQFNYSSIEARPPALALFCATLFVHSLIKIFEETNTKNFAGLFSSALLYILSTGIQPLSILCSAVFVAAVLNFFSKESKKIYHSVAKAIGIVILLYLPLFAALIKVAPSRLPAKLDHKFFDFLFNLPKGFTNEYIQLPLLAWISIISMVTLLILNYFKKNSIPPLLKFNFFTWIFFQIFYVAFFLTFVQWRLNFWYMLSSTAFIWIIIAQLFALSPQHKASKYVLLALLAFYSPKSSLQEVSEQNGLIRNNVKEMILQIGNEENSSIVYKCLNFNFCTEIRYGFPYVKGSNYADRILNLSPADNSPEELLSQFAQMRHSEKVYLAIGDCLENTECSRLTRTFLNNPNFFNKTNGIFIFSFNRSDPMYLSKMANTLQSFLAPDIYDSLGSTFDLHESLILLHAFSGDKKLASKELELFKTYATNKVDNERISTLQSYVDYFMQKE